MKIGTAIRLLRLARGLTQTEVAASAEVSQGYFTMLELNDRKPMPRTLRAIAVGLGVQPDLLLSIDIGREPATWEDRRRAECLRVITRAMDELKQSLTEGT